jgi:hypothetical protein
MDAMKTNNNSHGPATRPIAMDREIRGGCMKYRWSLLFLFVSVLLPICTVTSQAQCVVKTLKVQVPFDFTIRNSQFPAGPYTFQQECARVYVRDGRGQVLHVYLSLPFDRGVAPPETKLVFFNFHAVHVLTSVLWERSPIGSELVRPGQEIEIASRSLPSKPVLAGAGGRP